MILKAVAGSQYHFIKGKDPIKLKNFKWATVQAYYSIFQAIRALIFLKGYKENSHHALLVAFKELYVNKKEVEERFLNYFEDAMDSRESADYGLTFSDEAAKETINNAEEVLKRARVLLK